MVLDLASILVGAGLTGGAAILGRAAGYARARRYRIPKPICGCRDHLSEHNPKTGKCMAQSGRDRYGNHVPCNCQHYIGPMPLDGPRFPFAELT